MGTKLLRTALGRAISYTGTLNKIISETLGVLPDCSPGLCYELGLAWLPKTIWRGSKLQPALGMVSSRWGLDVDRRHAQTPPTTSTGSSPDVERDH